MLENNQLVQIEKHIKNAWIAGIFSAVITFIYSIIGSFNEAVRFEYGIDMWSLLDVALVLGLTYGVYKKNRYSALGLLIYFVVSKIIMVATTGQFSGGIVSLLFIYFYFQGTKATFQLHKLLLETRELNGENKESKKRSYLSIILISIVAVVLILLIVIGVMSPEVEVIPGRQVNKEYVSFIREEGLIHQNEKIQYFYSDAVIDFKDGFYLITDEKVIVYCQDWEEPSIAVPYYQIIDIEFESDPSFINDSKITLFLDDDSTVFFPVSSEYGGDTKFYDRLVELWNEKRSKFE